MFFSIRRNLMLLMVATAPFGFGHRAMHKRQAPFGDLIQAAMRIVSPIIDPYDTVQDSPMIPKKVSVGGQQPSTGLRDSQILGLPEYSSLREVPICRGNSQICNFIACTAHNFKNDDNFSNLNLMAQIMSDKKLRTAVSTNPETVTSVCREQGLSEGQCRLFSRGFQLIDRFVSTIEGPEPRAVERSPTSPDLQRDLQTPLADDADVEEEATTLPQPIRPLRDLRLDGSSVVKGSRTWSTRNMRSDTDAKLPRPVSAVVTHRSTSMPIPRPDERRHQNGVPTARHIPPPRAFRPRPAVPKAMYITQRPKRVSTNEEYEEDDMFIIDYEDDTTSSRRKRANDDYYDHLSSVPTANNGGTTRQPANSAKKQNCLQYLG